MNAIGQVLKCVVCGSPIETGEERYADAWEASRKKFPCCSPDCAGAFDSDEHWVPAIMPAPASDEEQQRLLAVVRRRLRDGDSPRVVIREMLQAGVSAASLRKAIISAQIGAAESRKSARRSQVGGILGGLLTGTFTFFKSGDKRDPDSLEAVHADLERWEALLADESRARSSRPG